MQHCLNKLFRIMHMTNCSDMQPDVISVKDLIKIPNLRIPDYQRPYKWTEKNVNQLIDDIIENQEKSAYRIGTIVIHNNVDDGRLDIVDGQQRTITLFLIALFVFSFLKDREIQKQAFVKGDSLELYEPASSFSFSNQLTKLNVQKNFGAIKRRESDLKKPSFLKFFFNKCQFVKVVIDDISEAFQFFDSQNARGKDLEPHDLLKAYHLREMNESSTEAERMEVVKSWESMSTSELSNLFSQYLFRIKNWTHGKSARYFSKDDVDVFKGIRPDLEEDFPYTEIYRIAHYYVNEFNASCHAKIMQKGFDFPFQVDQLVINGKRFFEYIAFYSDRIKTLVNDRSVGLLKFINDEQKSRFRTGDVYVRNLFYCALIAFVDKFGEKYLKDAVEKLFIWAYTLRLKLHSVGIDSIDNYALNWGNSLIALFSLIRDANRPQDILNIELEYLSGTPKSTKEEDVVEKFRELGYYAE